MSQDLDRAGPVVAELERLRDENKRLREYIEQAAGGESALMSTSMLAKLVFLTDEEREALGVVFQHVSDGVLKRVHERGRFDDLRSAREKLSSNRDEDVAKALALGYPDDLPMMDEPK